MTREEYDRICDRLAREAIAYAARMAKNEAPAVDEDPDNVCESWIDIFLDEYLPSIDADALLSVTSHADAYEQSARRPAPSREIAAFHAFQADVWGAIHRMETTASSAEEETVARGMLGRYSSAKVAMEMAHWHAMDHAEGSDHRARWQRVRQLIERLSSSPSPCRPVTTPRSEGK